LTAGLIIAKGHSNRIPGKNLKDFCGKPLVAWSVIQMVNSYRVGEVWLSTDSEKIAEIGEKYGAMIIMRQDPAALDPEASAIPVLREMVRQITADHYCIALPTSPVRMPGDIDGMIAKHIEAGALQTVPMAPLDEIQLAETTGDRYNMRLWDKKGKFCVLAAGLNIWQAEAFRREQDRLPGKDKDIDGMKARSGEWIPGQQDWFYPEGGNYFYPVKTWQQWEADTPDQWAMCEMAFKAFILGPLGEDCYEDYGQIRQPASTA